MGYYAEEKKSLKKDEMESLYRTLTEEQRNYIFYEKERCFIKEDTLMQLNNNDENMSEEKKNKLSEVTIRLNMIKTLEYIALICSKVFLLYNI